MIVPQRHHRVWPTKGSSASAIWGSLATIALLGAPGCDSRPGQHSTQQEFVAEHRLLNSRDPSLRPTLYHTRIVVDPAQGQVRELRYVTTTLGSKLEPDISVWGTDHTGFASGSTSACRIFDEDNFTCYVLPGGLGDDVERMLSHGIGSQLRMERGNLTEISGADTIRYRMQSRPQ